LQEIEPAEKFDLEMMTELLGDEMDADNKRY
jgi:hypothetical protein